MSGVASEFLSLFVEEMFLSYVQTIYNGFLIYRPECGIYKDAFYKSQRRRGVVDYGGIVYDSDDNKFYSICLEIKSDPSDFHSGYGLNFYGDLNYLICPSEYKDCALEVQSKFGYVDCFLVDLYWENNKYYDFWNYESTNFGKYVTAIFGKESEHYIDRDFENKIYRDDNNIFFANMKRKNYRDFLTYYNNDDYTDAKLNKIYYEKYRDVNWYVSK